MHNHTDTGCDTKNHTFYPMLLGAHVSASGGLIQAIHNATKLDIDVIQIFGSSPVRWKALFPSKTDVEKFKRERKKAKIKRVYLHAPYLINLASEKLSIRHLSRVLLADNLKIANALGADGVIFHSGSAGSIKKDDAVRIVSDALKRIFSEVAQGQLLIENSAGAGNLIGDTLEEVSAIMHGVHNKRFGFCFDTCHGFASGIVDDYSANSVLLLAKRMKKMVGKEKLLALHINDSKFPARSKRDRHENIGEGFIGKEGFKNFLANDYFKKTPLILEVPGFDGNGPDKKNVEILRLLCLRSFNLRK